MTDQEINAAIACACGWRQQEHAANNVEATHCWIRPGNSEWQPEQVPNYCSDLNAMHEAEELLFKNEDLLKGYDAGLHHEIYPVWNATARQRAEAFLRTIGKWRDA